MKPQTEGRKSEPIEQINDDSVKHAPESGEPREMAERAGHEGSARPFEKSRGSQSAASRRRPASDDRSAY